MWLLMNLLIWETISRHIKEPKKIPPKVSNKKFKAVPRSVSSSPLRIWEKTMKNTAAVPSLRRLSPSRRTLNCLLVPISLRRATTATGSVAEMMEEKVKAAAQLTSAE